MIKLIASDMDGTLLDSRGHLDEEIYDIIGQLKKMGIRFAAASGRQFMSLKKKFAPVDDDVIYIAENGGYVNFRNSDLYLNPMEPAIVREIIDSAEEVRGSALFICGKIYSYTDNAQLAEIMRDPVFGYEIKLVESLKNVEDDIFKVGLFDTADPRESSMKIMEPRFGSRVHLTLSGYNSLDFLNPDVNKGVGLKHIQERFGIKKEETVVFGDNFNDIEMFDEAKMSYAMLNADEYVRSRAKEVIGTNDDNSVIKKLKEIIKEIG